MVWYLVRFYIPRCGRCVLTQEDMGVYTQFIGRVDEIFRSGLLWELVEQCGMLTILGLLKRILTHILDLGPICS